MSLTIPALDHGQIRVFEIAGDLPSGLEERTPEALLAAFDPLLKRADKGRVIGLTSSVGSDPRAFWAAYGSTKAAFESLLDSYAQEVEKIGGVKVAIVDPGATRTAMRAKAYPGEDPATVKPPETVAAQITQLLVADFTTRHRERVVNPS